MLSAYGASAITFMIVMYALEPIGPLFVVGFALGCLGASSYAFLEGSWPFGVAEIVWAFGGMGESWGTFLTSWQGSAMRSARPE